MGELDTGFPGGVLLGLQGGVGNLEAGSADAQEALVVQVGSAKPLGETRQESDMGAGADGEKRASNQLMDVVIDEDNSRCRVTQSASNIQFGVARAEVERQRSRQL